MAGGGSLGGDRGGHDKRGSLVPKKRKKKRVGFVLDMTPLVDIAFLLLTFFMLSTTMNTPQVMEMQIPPDVDKDVQVKESELMNILIRDDNKIFYKLGNETFQPINLKDLVEFAVNQNMRVKNRLITALKVSGQAQYGIVVDVLDALNLAEGKITDQLKTEGVKRSRKFALVPPTPEELEQVKAL